MPCYLLAIALNIYSPPGESTPGWQWLISLIGIVGIDANVIWGCTRTGFRVNKYCMLPGWSRFHENRVSRINTCAKTAGAYSDTIWASFWCANIKQITIKITYVYPSCRTLGIWWSKFIIPIIVIWGRVKIFWISICVTCALKNRFWNEICAVATNKITGDIYGG